MFWRVPGLLDLRICDTRVALLPSVQFVEGRADDVAFFPVYGGGADYGLGWGDWWECGLAGRRGWVLVFGLILIGDGDVDTEIEAWLG